MSILETALMGTSRLRSASSQNFFVKSSRPASERLKKPDNKLNVFDPSIPALLSKIKVDQPGSIPGALVPNPGMFQNEATPADEARIKKLSSTKCKIILL